ncbi:hypothetical protein Psuf_071450 [Phytohabitans suffuscus]|uniref:Uncharacterized protein n=1 Tax=Phytohabitans suffuscus TaxID=624315 RepID=A0A6F8YUN6_9ACTN|nr:hypothetical protein [Phytohabitans suffuscus]BCB89832.1 hypothetical protein Psuf_071450 [Phytohabitans suffuscus]
MFGVGAAVRAERERERHDPVADGQVHAVPGLVHLAGRLHAQRVRQPDVAGHLSPHARAGQQVGRVDGGRPYPDPHLARPGVRLGQLHDPQHVRTAERVEPDRPHG